MSIPSLNEEQSGNAMLELAIIIPVILGIFFVGFQFSNYLEKWQLATTFSREAANGSFRACAAERDDPAAPEVINRLSTCLREEHDRLINQAGGVAPNMQVIISIYRYDSDTNRVTREGIAGNGAPHTSKFTTGKFSDSDSILGSTLEDNRIVVVGEVYIPISEGIGVSAVLGDHVYASTIM